MKSINKEIKEYWENEAKVYGDCVVAEIEDSKINQGWINILNRVYPKDIDSPEILDIGTGPGYFALNLYKMGGNVTAIDLTNNMIDEAKKISDEDGKKIKFLTMDSHELDFDDNVFDMIISRNVTWTLDNPPKAYREWFRVLKPGGKLVIIDANFNLRFFDNDIQKNYEANLKIAEKEGLDLGDHKDPDESDRLGKLLYLSDKIRPQWDLNEMLEIGFKEFYVDMDFDKEVLTREAELAWGHCPSFLITAVK